jgi:hypothetical protein
MMSSVDWVTVVSTVSGAVVALAGTVLAFMLSSRDRRSRDDRADRRHSYLSYILAVEAVHSRLREVGSPHREIADRHAEARAAITESGIFSARETFIVTANQALLRAGETTLDALMEMYRRVRGGARTNTLAYHEAYHRYAEAIWALRQVARADLGAAPISPADVGKESWDSQADCDFCTAQAELARTPL